MTVEPGAAYIDDLTIASDELLYRRVTNKMVRFHPDGTVDRLQSNGFQDYPESALARVGVPAVAMSVVLESEMVRLQTSTADLLERWGPEYGLAVVSAGEVRQHGQGIVRWPTVEDPEHGMVFTLVGARKSDKQSKRISQLARLLVPPPAPA